MTTRKGRVYKNVTRCTKGMRKYETDRRYLSQYGFHNGARSRQLAGDLSPWRRERRGACIGSLTIGSSTPLKTEQHLIPTSLSSDTQSLLWYLWLTMAPQRNHPRRSPPTMAWPMIEPTPPPSKLRLLVARTDRDFHLCTKIARYLLANLCGCRLVWTITYVVYLHVGRIFCLRIYLHRSHVEVWGYQPRAPFGHSGEVWVVGWTQPASPLWSIASSSEGLDDDGLGEGLSKTIRPDVCTRRERFWYD